MKNFFKHIHITFVNWFGGYDWNFVIIPTVVIGDDETGGHGYHVILVWLLWGICIEYVK